MKNFLFFLVCCCTFICCSFSQKTNDEIIDSDFKSFVDIFPLRQVPFVMVTDSELASEFDLPLPIIPDSLVERFIKLKELSEKLAICPDEFIYGYRGFSRFDLIEKFVSVIITISADPGCGERDLMVNYNLQGEYIDHLLVFGSGFLKEPSDDDSSRTMVFHSCTVEKDHIEVYERVVNYSSRNRVTSEITNTRIYSIEADGTFQLLEE